MNSDLRPESSSVQRSEDADEAAVVARCQRGDSAAFRQLYDIHASSLFKIALLMTGSREDAEDALQDAFVNAWKAIGSYREGTEFRAWLVTILLNRVRSWRRRIARRTARVRLVPLDKPGPEPSYEDPARDPVESVQLLSALQKLGTRPRSIVVLRFYSGLSVPEIANAVGCPEGTVKSDLHRSLKTMRAHMDVVGKQAMIEARAQSQAQK